MAPVELQQAAEAGLKQAPLPPSGLAPPPGAAPPAEPPAPMNPPPAAVAPAVTPPVAKAKPAGPAYMQEDQPFKLRDYEEPKLNADAPWWDRTGGMLLKLALVVGMLLAALFALRKLTAGGGPLGLSLAKGRNLVVLETTTLGPGQAMHLVSVGGDRLLVVGASPQGLTTLACIDEPGQVQLLLAASRGQSTGFNQVYDLESVVQGQGGDMFRGALSDLNRRGGWD